MLWKEALGTLEEALGYAFRDRELLCTALTNSSYVKGEAVSADYNERLEFLGDAVLELTVSDSLYRRGQTLSEGQMTRLRASLVCEEALFRVAEPLHIGTYLRLGRTAEFSGARELPSVVSDAVEAIIGAMYLDGGYEAAAAFINRFIIPEGELKNPDGRDEKTRLQEYVSKRHLGTLQYVLAGTEGPEHSKTFLMELRLDGRLMGTGRGRTKQSAGQAAAAEAYALLTAEQKDGQKCD